MLLLYTRRASATATVPAGRVTVGKGDFFFFFLAALFFEWRAFHSARAAHLFVRNRTVMEKKKKNEPRRRGSSV